MTGISEILFLIFLITALLILPRFFKPAPGPKPGKKVRRLGKKMRAALVVSLAYPLVLAGVLRPWDGGLLLYAGLGILPVILTWALFWVFSAPEDK